MKISFCEQILKRLGWEKSIPLIVKSTNNLKTLEYYVLIIKHYFFLVFVTSMDVKIKIFKEEESIGILKILGLIVNI